MIQFNLLPDVKLAFIRAQRIKRLVIFVSVLLTIAALLIFIVLFSYVDIIQKKHLSDLNANIKTNQHQLLGSTNTNLNKILTIQNQLDALPALDQQKPVTTRLFDDMTKVTPAKASLSQITIDFTKYTMDIQGNADSLTTVNKFVDTLKFTTYRSGQSDSPAFSSVVLTSFGLQSGKGANFTIDLSFDPAIFNSANSGNLTVPPNYITTRSITQQPLFKNNPLITNGNLTSGG